MLHSPKLIFPIKSEVFFIPYKTCRAKDTVIRYPLNKSPLRVYYPKALSKTRITFLLSLKAVFDNIKQIKATNKGIKTTAVVKLKFYKNLEKRKIPLG